MLDTNDRLQELKQIAKSKEGFCLSDKFVSSQTKMLWQCVNGHVWETSSNNIKKGSWCKKCADAKTAQKQRTSIEYFKDYAISKGGICLTDEYINQKTRLTFQCSQKHQWTTAGGSIKSRGSWCKKCATKIVSESQKDELQTFIDIASSKGGKCLSVEYINASYKLLFECAKGHQWLGRPQGIKTRGTWCRKCYGTAKSDIEEMKSIAIARGGKCLSSEYLTDAAKLKWQCCEGHIWEASANNIKHDKWCPTCSEGLGERICRLFFQKLFGFDFVKVRPFWLKNSKGFRLELDGYSEELNLAFEHQGRQHYSDLSFFSNRISYDEEKRKLCRQRSVTLIEIPEVLSDTKIKDLKSFIIQECIKNNVELPYNINNIEITPFDIFTYTKNQERRLLAQRAEAKINSKGGTLLGTRLTDQGISFNILCSNNHHWSITKENLFRERWCPYCGKEVSIHSQFKKREAIKQKIILEQNARRELSITKALAAANSKGGKCLSEKYFNNTTKLLWQCSEGHEWNASLTEIKRGRWCAHCAGKVKSKIEEIIQVILKRGGRCFSTSYINNYSKLNIECEHGHRFNMSVKSIKIGCWCPKCAIDERAKKKRLSIDEMNLLAKRKYGKCLSTSYTNGTTKLLWECANGHQFYSVPQNVQTGYWCRKCATVKVIDKAAYERKKLIEQILSYKQGKAISIDTNFNRKSETTWQCINGHTWKSRIGNILDGHWCPRCSNKENWNKKKTTIKEVNEFAQSKGGDCLSNEYIDAISKLKFRCKEGHTWTSIWSNIKSKGSWCPQCACKHRWDKRRQKEGMLT